MPSETLEPLSRPLTSAERRLLGARIRSVDDDIRRANRAVIPGLIIIAILWGLTLLASDASWIIVTGFWLVVGTVILLWSRHDLKKHADVLSQMKKGYESALAHDTAAEYVIESRAFAEFEEFEDEGACYAFEIEGPKVVFVSGQEFYPTSKFPSLDFSLVYILDERGREVEMVIDKRGPKASPERVVPASEKFDRGLPEHLDVVEGSLNEVV